VEVLGVTLRRQLKDDYRQLELDFEVPFKPEGPIANLLTPKEIFDNCDESFFRRREDSRFDRKRANTDPRDLGEYFSMWSNTHPNGGLIVVGITDNKMFEGCGSLSTKQLNAIERAAETYCPDAIYKTKKIRIKRDIDKADDFIIVFYVEYNSNRVISTASGKVFRRIGDSKKEVKKDALRHLQAEKGEIRFEIEPCNLSYPSDFEVRDIDEFVEVIRIRKEWDESHTREHILSLMHLGKITGKIFEPNIALALLFAKDPRRVIPGCRIRFLRFSGETEGTGTSWNADKDEFIDGTIPSQINQAAQILKSQLRAFSRLGKEGQFYTSKEYPDFSWYEAVVNACAHRSYGNGMRNMNIFIKMFDDRLVIESPGGFPPFVTPQNIYETHNPRNPCLMDALYYLKLVKCAAEGTKRIRKEMRDMDLPEPEFKQDNISNTLVRVTLRDRH